MYKAIPRNLNVSIQFALIKIGLSPVLAEKLTEYFLDYYNTNSVKSICLLPEEIKMIYKAIQYKKILLKNGLLEKILLDFLFYLDSKNDVSSAYNEFGDWGIVYRSCVYSPYDHTRESYLDFLEEAYHEHIKDVYHLQELTGIYLLPELNKYEEFELPEHTLQNELYATEELEKTITIARYTKYSRAITSALQTGGVYKDLEEINPEDFGLSDTWNYCFSKDKHTTILRIIALEFLNGSIWNKSIQLNSTTLAKYLDASISLIDEAFEYAKRQ